MGKNVQHLSRREFLKAAALSAGAAAMTGSGFVFATDTMGNIEKPRLNPAFRIKVISENQIDLFTYQANGEVLSYRFKGMEAELFRQINEEKNFSQIVDAIAAKHRVSEDECRARVKKSLGDFEASRLIYYGEKMLVKISEVSHVR